MKEQLRQLLSNKNENVWPLPEWMLSEEDQEKLKREPSLGIVEIAGKDSIAAALLAGASGNLSACLPTIAYTGTQYGDWEAPFRAVEALRTFLPSSIRFYPPVVLGAPELWRDLCGGGLSRWREKYGFISPCMACHLYFHLLRVPLAWNLRSSVIVAGERGSHDGKIKLSQVDASLEIFRNFFDRFDVELLMPLRNVMDSAEIDGILGGNYHEGSRQLRCVLSGNYASEDGKVLFDEKALKMFLEEYAIPRAEAWLRADLKK